MGKPKSVQPPDPAQTAATQGQANIDAALATARLNQINQVSPWGNLTYSGDFPVTGSQGAAGTGAVPGTPATPGRWEDRGAGDNAVPVWVPGAPAVPGTPGTSGPSATGQPRTATISLPPDVQAALNSQNQVSRGLSEFARDFIPRVSQGLSSPFSLEGLPAAPQASSAERQRIEDALFGRLEPYLARDQQALDTKFANQGITQGSEAFRGGQDDLARARNDARLAAIGQGGQEYARSFGLETAARQNALQERLLGRSQPINEIAALLQGGPAIQNPNFAPPAQVGVNPADYMGALQQSLNAQQGNVNASNQSSASFNNLLGTGLTALALYGGGPAAGLAAGSRFYGGPR